MVKINITTEDGEVLDIFTVDWPGNIAGKASNVDLAKKIREILEPRFEVVD